MASNRNARLAKLEREYGPAGYVFVMVNDGETNEEAYQRCFADGRAKPKIVIYATPLDELI